MDSAACASRSVKCVAMLLASGRLPCLAFLDVKEYDIIITVSDACQRKEALGFHTIISELINLLANHYGWRNGHNYNLLDL